MHGLTVRNSALGALVVDDASVKGLIREHVIVACNGGDSARHRVNPLMKFSGA